MVAELAHISNSHGVALSAFDGGGDASAADSDLDDFLDAGDSDSIAGYGLAVYVDFEVWLADDAVGDDGRGLDARDVF